MAGLSWYKITGLRLAHAGAGRDNGDTTWYVQAPDMGQAYARIKMLPGVKKGRRAMADVQVLPVNGLPPLEAFGSPPSVPWWRRTPRRCWYWREQKLDKIKKVW